MGPNTNGNDGGRDESASGIGESPNPGTSSPQGDGDQGGSAPTEAPEQAEQKADGATAE